MAKKILVPIDGSEASVDALKYAVKMAEVVGKDAVIVALEVMDINKYQFAADAIDLSTQDKLLEAIKKDAEDHLKKAKNICNERGVNVETVIRQGFAHEEIIKHAEDNEDIKLIVMGASGKGFIDQHILGSVTSRIIQEVGRKLPCPVMITPHRKEAENKRWNFNDLNEMEGCN